MKRFSVRALLGLVAVAAVIVWWVDPGFHVIYDEVSPSHGRLLISGKRVRKTNQYKLRVKYIPNQTDPGEIQWSPPLVIEGIDNERMAFDSIVDANTGTWCVYDTADKQFVFMAFPGIGKNASQGRYWHPGMRIGWARGLWIARFRDIRTAHPEIPYAELPSELRLDTGR